tara:strand:- start:835 stop:1998 length:1164 start_codon:yes stop_codon:yes gene_type:complete
MATNNFRYVRVFDGTNYRYILLQGTLQQINQDIDRINVSDEYTVDTAFPPSSVNRNTAHQNMINSLSQDSTIMADPLHPKIITLPGYQVGQDIPEDPGTAFAQLPNFSETQNFGGLNTLNLTPSIVNEGVADNAADQAAAAAAAALPENYRARFIEGGEVGEPGADAPGYDRDVAAGFQRYMTDLFGGRGIAPTSRLGGIAQQGFDTLRNLYDVQARVTQNPLFETGGGVGSFVDFLNQRTGTGLGAGAALGQALGNAASLMRDYGTGGIVPGTAGYGLVEPYLNPEGLEGARRTTNALSALISQLRMPGNLANIAMQGIDPMALMARYQATPEATGTRSFLEYAANQLGLGGFLQPTMGEDARLRLYRGGTPNWAVAPLEPAVGGG